MHLMHFFQAPGLVGMRKQKQRKQKKKTLLGLENMSDAFLRPDVGVVGKKKRKMAPLSHISSEGGVGGGVVGKK